VKRYGQHILFTLLLGLTADLASAQREADNWVCKNALLNFGQGGGDPTLTGPISNGLGGGNATVSDPNGQLLFYSDGNFVFNRLQQIMPALTVFVGGLLQGPRSNRSPASQGTMALPFVGNDSLYYLFYIRHSINNWNSSQLFYAIINMRANGGLGDVVQRDIPLLGGQDVCLKLNAALHCNKKDIWAVGHIRYSNQYFALPITATGIGAPVYSAANMIPPDPLQTGEPAVLYEPEDGMGCLKISPMGDKLAAAHLAEDYVELCDFNNQTGGVTNPQKLYVTVPYDVPNSVLFTNGKGAYGVEFSASSQKLYVTSNYAVDWAGTLGGTIWHTGHLYQFNLMAGSTAAIQASRYFIDSAANERYWGIQLANNGKIYINTDGAAYISRIANPEGSGPACGYNRQQIYDNGGNRGKVFPTFLQSYFRYPIIATGNCQFTNISFNIQNPVGISTIAWHFGDPASGAANTSTSFNPTHIYTAQGIYTVRAVLQNSNGCGADTITKLIHAGPFRVFLGNDTTICKGDTLTLRMNLPGASNSWNNNSTDTLLRVTQPGRYWVTVRLGDCSATDTIEVFERPLPQFTLGNDTTICSNGSLVLSPQPTYAGSFLWSNGTTLPTTTVNTVGNHWLQITDNLGCRWRDTINIQLKTLPNFSLGNDTAICQRDTLLLNAMVNGATGYTWNTGATSPQIKINQSGIYWCDVNNQGCIYRDSMALTVKTLPVIHLGNDTTLCENTALLLHAQNPGSGYLWNTGSTGQTYLVSQAGLYSVTVTNNHCVNKDSITIAYESKPSFSLGADKLICPGETVTLQPAVNPLWQLLWQDGSTANTYKVTQPGLYYLDATASCGTTRDEILFTKGFCKVYIPNAFTPNGDGRNDLLKVYGTELVIIFHLQIFNRYGQLVFETRDKNKGWDGRLNGQVVNNGAYIYTLTYQEQGGLVQNIAGSILLIR
jgi:gliding motility-associated-like protein